MAELWAASGGSVCAADQVLYNLDRRAAEWSLVPWCRERTVAVMAYTPLEPGRVVGNADLAAVAARLGATPGQVALASFRSWPLSWSRCSPSCE